MTSLIIVESEEKAKTIKQQCGGLYDTLLLQGIPMRVRHDPSAEKLWAGESGFQFVPADGAKPFVEALLANLHKDIYLALDSDQRGELWSWMVGRFLYAVGKGHKNARRLYVSGYNKDEISSSLRLVAPADSARAASWYIRSLFNTALATQVKRLIGTATGPNGLPLTFSSLTTLLLFADREAMINAGAAGAAPWRVNVRCTCAGGEFMGYLREAFEIVDDGVFRDGGQVKQAVALLDDQACHVRNRSESPFSIKPPGPYRLVDLLHDGYVLLGMRPADVVGALRRMYHGVEIDGCRQGIVSNPFVQGPWENRALVEQVAAVVENRFGAQRLHRREVVGGIFPLRPEVSGEHLPASLPIEERALYGLIRERAVASQMGDAIGKNILLTCGAGACVLAARRPLLEEEGFLAAFQAGYDADLTQPCPVATLAVGDEVRIEQIIPEQDGSADTEQYTFETLFDDLADFSIPLEASTVSMTQMMLEKGYLALDANGTLHLGDNGRKVVAIMNRAFPAMQGINLVAYCEQTINEVVSGRKSLDFALRQFDQNCVMHGVPLVKVKIPSSISLGQQRSKNIIKSSAESDVQAPPASLDRAPAGEGDASDSSLAAPLPRSAADAESEKHRRSEDGELTGRNAALAQDGVRFPAAEPALTAEEAAEVLVAAAETDDAADVEPPEGVEADRFNEKEEGDEPEVEAAPHEAPSEEQLAHSQAGTEQEEVDESAPQSMKEEKRESEAPSRPCPECGRPLLLKSDRFGTYWACSGYPACRYSASNAPPKEQVSMLCPLCSSSQVIVKQTPSGKDLYVCASQGCEFMAWSRPHAIACPSCGFAFLVEKKDSSGQVVLRCPRAGCSYFQPLAGQAEKTDVGHVEEPPTDSEAAPKKKKIVVRRRAGGAAGVTKKVVVRRVKKS